MNQQDEANSANLMPAGSSNLAPLGVVNLLITRGLAELTAMESTDVSSTQPNWPPNWMDSLPEAYRLELQKLKEKMLKKARLTMMLYGRMPEPLKVSDGLQGIRGTT